MNLDKIGKFIGICRKRKKLTQQDLAEKIGVSDRTIGNWENGRNLPDISLFEPLCNELDITINDLISGEKVNDEEYQEVLEKNIINTIEYTNKIIKKKNYIIGYILLVLGIFISLFSLSIYPGTHPVNIIGSIIGLILNVIGICMMTIKLKLLKKILLIIVFILLYSCVLFTLDVIGIISMDFSFYI